MRAPVEHERRAADNAPAGRTGYAICVADEQLQAQAWVGDAVLCLYGRLRILREQGRVDGAKYHRMASNQFLSAFGEPTAVEAELGRVFEQRGLDEAFAWIEQRWMPLFERQEANRGKRSRAAS